MENCRNFKFSFGFLAYTFNLANIFMEHFEENLTFYNFCTKHSSWNPTPDQNFVKNQFWRLVKWKNAKILNYISFKFVAFNFNVD